MWSCAGFTHSGTAVVVGPPSDEEDSASVVVVVFPDESVTGVQGVTSGSEGNWRSAEPLHKLGPSAPQP